MLSTFIQVHPRNLSGLVPPILSGLMALSVLITTADAQESAPPMATRVTESVESQPGQPSYQVFRLTVSPARETQPAMKYRFTVPPDEQVDGNAIVWYLRSLGEGGWRYTWENAQRTSEERVYDWLGLETPDSEVPLETLRQVVDPFRTRIDGFIRPGTRCRDADWNLRVERLRGTELLETLLPSVQETRSFARAISLRCRLACTEARFGDAVDDLTMMYQLGQHVSQMDLLVASLVGFAIVGIADTETIRLISAEDSPNLYWALAELPQPVIDLRRTMRVESHNPRRFYYELFEASNESNDHDVWNSRLESISQRFLDIQRQMSRHLSNDAADLPAEWGPSLMNTAIGIASYGSAKRRLLQTGEFATAELEAMPVAKVLMLDAAREIEYFSQQFESFNYLPYNRSFERFRKLEQELQQREFSSLAVMLANQVYPATRNVLSAQARVQAQINVLMAIESLRNHAAVHGQFPQTLAELELPVRNNPMTQQPFDYRLDEGQATIEFVVPGIGQRYEIKLAD